MERGMGLVPEARVNKKLTVSDFFSKVGYVQKKAEETTAVVVDPASAVQAIQAAKADVAPVDCEMAGPAKSVSSPPPASSPSRKQALPYTLAFAPDLEESDEEEVEVMPTLAELMVAKAKSPTPECEPIQAIEEVEPQPKSEAEQVQPLPAPGSHDIVLEDSSEEEAPLPKHLKSHKLLFAKRDYAKIEKDRKAAKFHALARPDSPTKAEARLEKQRKAELLARVAWQAKAEREAREAALKAAGMTLLSAEERAKEAIEVEDLVERARRQAEELRKLEKAEDAKRKAVEDGVNDEEEEDEDYNGESPARSNSTDADDSGNVSVSQPSECANL
jgi:mediator of replication checkpoint protein 1